MRITISGMSGSGKSTVAKTLAAMLSYRHYSMGDLQREIAVEKGISILELMELEKKDDSIDRMIDARQAALSKRDDFVIDSWLGAHFIPNSFKVFLDADAKVRAERIMKAQRGEVETYGSLGESVSKLAKREQLNRERWLAYYGFDFMDRANYDLVIDTTGMSIEEIAGVIKDALRGNSA